MEHIVITKEDFSMFCGKCGMQCMEGSGFCSGCGTPVGVGQQADQSQQFNQVPPYPGQPMPGQIPMQKSKIAAGLLGIFLGVFGVHNFYLGFTGRGVG